MQLTHLSLTNFRNFSRLDIDIPGGSVLLVGGNAQGKTSLLEAIYYLATFTSFHASADRQLINYFLDKEPLAVARINAEFRYSGVITDPISTPSSIQRMEVRLIRERENLDSSRFRKEILINGVVRKVGDSIGVFNAVLFLPQMLRVIEGPPEERRRLLNLAVSQVTVRYAADLAEYHRVLTQRNALLKQLYERAENSDQLHYWDEQLAALGSKIIYARIHAVSEIGKISAAIHRELTRDQEMLRLDYQPAFDPLPEPQSQYLLPIELPSIRTGITVLQIEHAFLERLQRNHSLDIQRGTTSIGPHRDEIRFLSNGVDLGIFGSRGQGRTAMLSFKIAEMSWMRQKTGQTPVLLLDEVFAELDPYRREDLLVRLSECEQTLLTTTDLEMISGAYQKSACIWRINAGQVVV